MAEKYSTGLRNWLLGGKDLREAFDDFIIRVFSGSAPSDADQAESGTLLCTITKNSGSVNSTDRSIAKQASISITSASTNSTIIIAINSVEYTYTVLSSDDTLRKVARKVALMLEDIPEIHAIAHATSDSDGNIAIKSAIAGLEFTIAKGSNGSGGTATWSLTDNTISNVRINALQWGTPSGASMGKPSGEIWSGVNIQTGTASWFRIVRPDDTGASSTTARRIQGAVATSGAELNLSNINLVQGATLTIDSATFTLPVS